MHLLSVLLSDYADRGDILAPSKESLGCERGERQHLQIH